jgi:hypothetical protein
VGEEEAAVTFTLSSWQNSEIMQISKQITWMDRVIASQFHNCKIAPARNSGGKVELFGDNGTRQTILGFNSEAEAEVWVAEDKRLEAFRQVLTAD